MPHQVVKVAVRGSVGDLARITDLLEELDVNIVGLGGAETAVPPSHVGIIALILEPDEDNMSTILGRLRSLVLDENTNRRPERVDALPDVQIRLDDTPGQLKKAARALEGINIETVVTLPKHGNKAVVSLGFQPNTYEQAKERLRHVQDVEVIEDPHHPDN